MRIKQKIDEKLVTHVANLARIRLSKNEKKKFVEQFNSILEYFKRIDEVDTSHVDPSFHVVEIKNVFREGEKRKFDWNPLENTSHKEKKYFKGPRIV
jgi:aspartyl-tRNA(Asn)/glutamyl-tRNA(Gln) amidotransferase subunit C